MHNNSAFKVAKFVKRLYKIVDDPEVKEVLWSKSGKSFIIPDKEAFLKNALSLISKTKEYAAFVRLLNHYGFIKATSISDTSEEYFHRHFFKGNEENLGFISRVKYKSSRCDGEIVDYKKESQIMKRNLEYLSTNNYNLSKEVANLKERMDKQDKTISGLIEVLSRVFKVGIQSHEHKALVGESKILENAQAGDINKDLEPQNKRRLKTEEARNLSALEQNDINQLMLMGESRPESSDGESSEKDANFTMNDFF